MRMQFSSATLLKSNWNLMHVHEKL